MQNRAVNVWWTGIDISRNYCSYQELKQRQVVAQGVPKLGSLQPLLKYLQNEYEFKEQIVQLGDLHHIQPEDYWWQEFRESNIRKIPTSMFNLLSLSINDLVVAIEGITVKGICYLPNNAKDSYQYQPAYDYAHAVGFPIKWIDWKTSIFGPPPIPPAQSVYGIRSLNKQRDYVIACWEKL